MPVWCRLEQAPVAHNELYMSKSENTPQHLKIHQYEQGEKGGHLMVAQLRQLKAPQAITAIRSLSGEVLTRPQEIVNELSIK
ncbi:hypothetical protein NDU88_000226 [Pleurodeles waltl]|uniref:Uncharacterized protein n=1 Tax=Pleurodeles waltl TaxID=8319 RepID=A0AAV7TEU8_PLEWA|nr:hypothetical protein NDU88_000226 [Pleurodeles waltl]